MAAVVGQIFWQKYAMMKIKCAFYQCILRTSSDRFKSVYPIIQHIFFMALVKSRQGGFGEGVARGRGEQSGLAAAIGSRGVRQPAYLWRLLSLITSVVLSYRTRALPRSIHQTFLNNVSPICSQLLPSSARSIWMCPDHDSYLHPVSWIHIFSKNSFLCCYCAQFQWHREIATIQRSSPNMFDQVGCKYVYIYSISLWIICS